MRRSASMLFKAAVSVAFFALLYRAIRGSGFTDIVRGADPVYVTLSLAMMPVLLVASCSKWKVLLDAQGCVVPFAFLMKCYFIGYYFSNLLPSMVGGDVARIYYAGKRIGSHGHAAASVFLERFTGILLLLALVVFAPLIRPELYRHPAVWIPALGAAALLAVLLSLTQMRTPLTRVFEAAAAFALRMSQTPRISRRPAMQRLGLRLASALRSLAAKAAGFHEKLSVGVAVLRSRPRVLWKVVALTLLFYLLAGVNVWLAFRTFGRPPPIGHVIAILPTALLVAMIPITLGSLGITETSFVFYFGLVGMGGALAAAMALFLRFKMILLGLIGLGFYVAHGERFRPEAPDRAGRPSETGPPVDGS